jgi:hypothetical protein
MMSATTASFQVIEELLCISFFNARDRQVSTGDPMEKVFRCPNVLARCNPLITALGQFLGESFKQMTTGATAQLLDTRWPCEIANQHDVPPPWEHHDYV